MSVQYLQSFKSLMYSSKEYLSPISGCQSGGVLALAGRMEVYEPASTGPAEKPLCLTLPSQLLCACEDIVTAQRFRSSQKSLLQGPCKQQGADPTGARIKEAEAFGLQPAWLQEERRVTCFSRLGLRRPEQGTRQKENQASSLDKKARR